MKNKEILISIVYDKDLDEGTVCHYFKDFTFEEVYDDCDNTNDNPSRGKWRTSEDKEVEYLLNGDDEVWNYDEFSEKIINRITENELLGE